MVRYKEGNNIIVYFSDSIKRESDFDLSSDSDFEHIPTEALLPEVVLFTPPDSADNSQTSASTSAHLKGRKRMRNEENWVRNIRKKSRNMGLPYMNSKNILVSGKEFKPIEQCCAKFCYKQFSPNHQKTVFDCYYKLGNFDLQTSYLCDLVNVIDKKRCYTKNDESRRSKSRSYRIPDLTGTYKDVCKTFFSKLLQVSDGRISRALINKAEGNVPPKDKRGSKSSANTRPNNKIKLDLQKRTAEMIKHMDILYPNLKCISAEKKKDLLQQLDYAPLMHHEFLENLSTSPTAANDACVELDENESAKVES